MYTRAGIFSVADEQISRASNYKNGIKLVSLSTAPAGTQVQKNIYFIIQ
jgi:hypothetical protein